MDARKETPGQGGNLGAGAGAEVETQHTHDAPNRKRPQAGATRPVAVVEIELGPGERRAVEVRGKAALTLLALVRAGPRGITSLELSPARSWALRLAAYIHDLRRRGFVIATQREDHDGGWHGRYVLHQFVRVLHFAPHGAAP